MRIIVPKIRWAALALAAAALSVGVATPAQAANSPQIRSTGSTTTTNVELTTVDVRYRCAPGAVVGFDARLWQGGTSENPVSLLQGPAFFSPATCDGKKHTTTLTLRIADWDPEYGSANYNLLTTKANGGERAHLTVMLHDHLGNILDVDHDRVSVVAG